MEESELKRAFAAITSFKENPFHPLVWIAGEPIFGENVFIGAMSEVNAVKVRVEIGDNCDIASFVSINAADSHRKTLGIADDIDRRDIKIEANVFIGGFCMVKGGAHIGHHTVVAAGTIVGPGYIPPYSLVYGNPMQVKPGYYKDRVESGVREKARRGSVG